jgi:anaerobic selenocysteine-containing dehydrogenase
LKSLIVLESDPLGELPDTLKGKMALKKPPFLVAITPFLNETARSADIIFPAAISPESTNLVSCHLPVSRHYLRVRKKALAPRGQSQSYQTTIGLLATALGAGKLFAFNEGTFMNMLFKSSPFTQSHSYEVLTASPLPMIPLYRVRDLFPHPHRKSFDTPSGKVMFRSSPLLQMGFNPYPEWWPPLEGKILTPVYFTRYPLILATGRVMEGETPEGNNCVLINPLDARTLGLAEGAEVWVESKINKIKKKVKIRADITRGVVWMPWDKNPLRDKEVVAGTQVNYLIDGRNNDPVCGAPRFNEMLVKVYPA